MRPDRLETAGLGCPQMYLHLLQRYIQTRNPERSPHPRFNYFEGGYGYDRKKKVRQQNLVVVYSSAYIHKVRAENGAKNTS